MLINYILLAIIATKFCDSARILGVVFTPSYSHQIAFQPIWRELSLRGHQLTVLTTNPLKDPTLKNLTEIDLSTSYDIMKSYKTDELLSTTNESTSSRLKKYMDALHEVADHQLSNSEVQNLIHNRRNDFDLLMVEVIHPTHMILSWWFQIPFIGMISLDAPSRIHSALGNPVHPVLYPDYNISFNKQLTFTERLISTLFQCFMWWYDHYRLHPKEEETIKKYFGEEAPKISDIQKNMSMLFLNINPILHAIRPLGPSTIQIGGGMHLQKIKPLSKSIQTYLDESKQGFIYFSLGTNVKSSALDNSTKNSILEAFATLPFNILWKFEDNTITSVPKNVKIVQWVSQPTVLAHQNIKVFITQCGLQSIEEAILNNVPMVGLPFYGDQGRNAKIIESKGLGLILDHKTLNKETFLNIILKVINNETYKNNIYEIAKLLKDEAMSGLEKAIWWTEYVIRHKGAKHLRAPGLDVPLYQYLLLDVIAFILVIIFIIFKIITLIFKCIFGRRKIKRD